MRKLKVIDLFAGAGGLSLGFKQSGKFKIMAAVEKNTNAQNTYKNNFPGVDLYSDILGIDFKEFKRKYGEIDVVVGGPPCQGFSNANRQHNQAINLNNKLVKEFIRAILQIQPKAFVMENVGMLKSDVHRFYIGKEDLAKVKKYCIPTKQDSIFMLEEKWKYFGILQLLKNRDNVKRNLWPFELFKALNIIYKNRNNITKLQKAIEKHKSSICKMLATKVVLQDEHINQISERAFGFFKAGISGKNINDLIPVLEEAISLQKMLIHTNEIYINGIRGVFDDSKDLVAKVESCAVYDYLTCILGAEDNGYAINNGILAAVEFGIPQKRRRFVIIGVKKEYTNQVDMPIPDENISMTNVYDALADLKNLSVRYSVEEDEMEEGAYICNKDLKKVNKLSCLRDSGGRIYNHVIPRTRENALRRFQVIKPGENFHALSKEMKENTYTNVERTQNTVYLRLKYDEPSGTVINVRKSMWIHPELNRAVSIREAARLQTFPDSFRFYGPKDAEYQQVGNAVPPMLAQIIAKKIFHYIG